MINQFHFTPLYVHVLCMCTCTYLCQQDTFFLHQGQVLSKGFNIYTDTNSSDRRKLLSSFPKYCNPWTIRFRPWANVLLFFFFISSFCLSTLLSENVKKTHVFQYAISIPISKRTFNCSSPRSWYKCEIPFSFEMSYCLLINTSFKP